MPGVKGKSGRRKKPGKRYYLGYFRLIPGEDPPELEALLDAIIAAKGRKRRDIIRAALLGGAEQAQDTAQQVEDGESVDLFADMFADF
jgi:hypothetical protein